MKALLLKDLYLSWKYYKPYFIISLFFTVLSFWTNNNIFMLSYPLMLIGMIPIGLQNMDESYKWDIYCGSLPCTKKQVVSEKYIIGLLFTFPVTVMLLLAKALGMALDGSFNWAALGMLLLIAWLFSFLMNAISLPLIFKFGSEKGRVAQYLIIGAACGISTVAGLLSGGQVPAFIENGFIMFLLLLAPVALYAVSWYLSIRFYEKREIR